MDSDLGDLENKPNNYFFKKNLSIFILVLEAPKSASRRIEDYGEEDEFGAKDFSKELSLKADHQNRPLWIVRN